MLVRRQGQNGHSPSQAKRAQQSWRQLQPLREVGAANEEFKTAPESARDCNSWCF